MKQWYMIIDVAKCEDCNNCLLACKDEHVGNEWPGYSAAQPRHGQKWIGVERKERGQFPLIDVVYRPTMCMQCEQPPCVAVSGGSVVQRADGIVLIDPRKSKGQLELVDACPYGMIWWNEEASLPQKCTFCAHLIDKGWKHPRCVQACPTGALRAKYLEAAEMRKIAEAEGLKPLHAEFNTSPRVLYANVDRFDRCFIAGSIAREFDGVVECVEGARVVLWQAGEERAETRTDAFGDFKIDGLPKDSAWYVVRVQSDSSEKREVSIAKLKESLNIGTMCFGSCDKTGASKSKKEVEVKQ